jgi:uncharacterized protein YkwD
MSDFHRISAHVDSSFGRYCWCTLSSIHLNHHNTETDMPTSAVTRPQLEALSSREMPAVVGLTPMVPVLANGILTVMGTNNADTITVGKSGDNITVLGRSFPSNRLWTIVVAGEEGDDTIRISESITQRCFLYGDHGNDRIYGGGGVDVIYGGLGNDTINGGPGEDKIYGGAGKDTIDGGPNWDRVLDYDGDAVTSAYTNYREPKQELTYATSSYAGQVANEVLRLINLERAKVGASAISLTAQLTYSANDHAKTLAALTVPIGEVNSHKISSTSKPTFGTRLDANFIKYNSAAENNARIQPGATPSATELARRFMYGTGDGHGLMNSRGHKENILSRSFTKVGLGLAGDLRSGYYLVQIFIG